MATTCVCSYAQALLNTSYSLRKSAEKLLLNCNAIPTSLKRFISYIEQRARINVPVLTMYGMLWTRKIVSVVLTGTSQSIKGGRTEARGLNPPLNIKNAVAIRTVTYQYLRAIRTALSRDFKDY